MSDHHDAVMRSIEVRRQHTRKKIMRHHHFMDQTRPLAVLMGIVMLVFGLIVLTGGDTNRGGQAFGFLFSVVGIDMLVCSFRRSPGDPRSKHAEERRQRIRDLTDAEVFAEVDAAVEYHNRERGCDANAR